MKGTVTYSVSSKGASSSVMVDTRLVGGEVLVDGEGSRDGSVLHDITLDVLNTREGV